ncbi:hypothetical protein GUJ93_ZPchr0013g36940 [Zizania palustris]|uniref:Uncharacterized protein n=1 Tax=Zizania palustris TaxID=103762 RepID=A0A8J5WUZ9_ZIZPA|nr:hypothetical protein GUJ93_ZPchr0013g36940 [Zizania palustris]
MRNSWPGARDSRTNTTPKPLQRVGGGAKWRSNQGVAAKPLEIMCKALHVGEGVGVGVQQAAHALRAGVKYTASQASPTGPASLAEHKRRLHHLDFDDLAAAFAAESSARGDVTGDAGK